MSTATTTDTGQTTSRRTNPTSTNPATQTEHSAANRLGSTMAVVRLAFTWPGARETLAPEQRDTAARAFQADRELLSDTKLILDTKHPSFRNVARVRSEASGYWRTVALPFPEAGIRFFPQNSLGAFASTMAGYRESHWPPVNCPASTTRSRARPSDDLARSSTRPTTPRRSTACSTWMSPTRRSSSRST